MPPPPRTGSLGRRLVWALAAVLLVVAVAGFGLAALASATAHDTYAEEYDALGDRDAGEATKALDVRVSNTMRAYDAYVTSAEQVHRRHEAVTGQFNRVVTARASGNDAALARARSRLAPVIARYRQALARERQLRSDYLGRLARLEQEMAR